VTQTVRLPKGWVEVYLRDVAWNMRPRSKPQDYPNLRFIGMDNVEAHTMQLLGTVPATTVRSSATHFKTGDVLYGRLRPYLNKVICVDFEGLASAEFIPLTAPEGVVPDFLKYRLNSAEFVAFTSKLDTGDRPRVDYDQIGEFKFQIPPTGTQQRIVEAIESYLTRLDAAVASLERVQKNLERYRASVLKAAVEGRLVPTEADIARKEGLSYEPASELLERILAERKTRWIEDAAQKARAKGNADALLEARKQAEKKYKEPAAPDTTDLPILPEGWCWSLIPALIIPSKAGMKTGPFGSLLKKREHRSQGIPVLGIENIGKRRYVSGSKIHITLEKAEELAGYDVQAKDLLISRSGTVGEVCTAPNQLRDARFSTNVMRIRFLEPVPMADYVALLLAGSPFVRGEIEELCKGTTRIFLNQSILSQLVIPIPPLAEQRRILEEVASADESIEATLQTLTRSVARSLRLRQSILKWAFEGKLVEQDPSDEPASELLERIKTERSAERSGTRR